MEPPAKTILNNWKNRLFWREASLPELELFGDAKNRAISIRGSVSSIVINQIRVDGNFRRFFSGFREKDGCDNFYSFNRFQACPTTKISWQVLFINSLWDPVHLINQQESNRWLTEANNPQISQNKKLLLIR